VKDVPTVALAAASITSSVVCPDASSVFGDTMGDVVDAVAKVALGACGVSPVSLDGIPVSTLGSCPVSSDVDDFALITLGSCARCCCLMPVVCAGVVVFVLVCNGAIARCRIFAI